MENVSSRCAGAVLDLPAAPHFRLEKEIKNVITVIAKTSHYWLGHMPLTQQREVGDVLMRMDAEDPLLAPESSPETGKGRDALVSAIAERIRHETGLPAADRQYADWLGVECPDVRSAVWMMRALVASNVLARREDRALFVPINASLDPDGSRVAAAVGRVHRYASARGVS